MNCTSPESKCLTWPPLHPIRGTPLCQTLLANLRDFGVNQPVRHQWESLWKQNAIRVHLMLPRWLKIWKMQRDPHHLDGASALLLFCKQCINYMSVQTMGHGSLNAPLHHPCCMTSSWYLHRNHLQCSGGWLSTLSLHGTIFLPWQPCFSYFDSASYCHPRGDVTRHVLMEVVPAVRASHGDAGRQDVEASKWNMEEEHKQELSVCGDMPIPKLKKTRVNTVLRNHSTVF